MCIICVVENTKAVVASNSIPKPNPPHKVSHILLNSNRRQKFSAKFTELSNWIQLRGEQCSISKKVLIHPEFIAMQSYLESQGLLSNYVLLSR